MRRALALVSLGLLVPGCGDAAESTGGDGDAPAEKAALFEFLTAGRYKTFAAESAAHPSDGPHSGDVRVFLGPLLEGSLQAGNETHPKGAAVVKELAVKDGAPGGWAVFVKTEEDSRGGDAIYWYETLDTKDGSNPPYEGKGEGICKDCHSAGIDFYLSKFPLK